MRRVFQLFFATLGLALTFAATAPARADSASECVTVRTTAQSTGLAFDVKNACDKRLSCAVTWSLACSNASGKTTSKTRSEAKFGIGPDTSHSTFGSAESCKDSWKIDDVSWDCAAEKK